MGKPLSDLTGFRFGSLTVLRLGKKERPTSGAWWLCACDCGTQKNIPATDMVQGKISSCGCEHAKRIGLAQVTHGMSKGRTYKIWMAMRNRCNRLHQDYSARGITYDKRWDVFENFLADMGERPSSKHTLDRINGSKGYEPGNCRWATPQQQQLNLKNNVRLEFEGKSLTAGEWSRIVGLGAKTISARYQKLGWTAEEALTLPLHFHHKHRT